MCNVMKNNGSLGITRHVGVEGGGEREFTFSTREAVPNFVHE